MYICSSVNEILERYKISYIIYSQDKNLRIIDNIKLFKMNSAILLVNYFGSDTCEQDLNNILYDREDFVVVVDNVQSYYRFLPSTKN